MRTSRREMRDLLEIAGHRDVPSRVEGSRFVVPETLAVTAAPEATTDELAERRERRRRTPLILAGAAATVALVVLVGALVSSQGDGGNGGRGSELALVTAVDTVVVLPDGSTVTGARGVVLPDGTVIRTGPQGRATVAGVHLGPDTEAVVRDGRVRVRESDGGAGETRTSSPTESGDGGGTTGSSDAGTSGGGTSTPSTAPPPPPPVVVPPLPLPSLPLPSLPNLGETLPIG